MLNKKILWKLLFEEPFLAGDEEETNNLLIKKSKRLEKSKKMKVKHIPTYNEVKDIYNILINKLWDEEYLDRDDIREIIKIN